MRSTGSKKNLMKLSDASVRKELVDMNNKKLTVQRQAELLSLNRSSLYRKPVRKLITDEELFIMRRIDEIHTDEPTWGYRTITRILRRDDGILINRKRTRRIMKDMGIYTLYPKPNLSKRYHSQYIKPYLLRNLAITHANQVWGVDITYIRMKKGFIYLFVILDFTNPDYVKMVEDAGVRVSMDGKGQCLANARTERFFRTLSSMTGST